MPVSGHWHDIIEAGVPVSATWITQKGLVEFFRHRSQCPYSKH